MHVERITTWTELSVLEPAWNVLAADMPFRHWDWLATWWKHYGCDTGDGMLRDNVTSERQLNVLAVYDSAESINDVLSAKLVGIAPWYIDHSALKGNVLRWLGSGEVCTDHLSFLCRPEDGERVAVAVADALTITYDDWDSLQLDGVDADDVVVAHLVNRLASRDCLVSSHMAEACWALKLPATWDDYLAGLSKSHRKQLRQLERRVLESNRVKWHRLQYAEQLNEAWGIFVDLHQRRRRSLGEPGCFASRRFANFHRDVVERFCARGQLRMSWVSLDGAPAAAEYHLADASATYAYQGGVDPDRLAEEPGRLSTILCLRQAIEEGHQHFDFLRGDEPYKAHWRAAPRPTCDYRVAPNRRLARLRGRVWNVADTLSDLARQGTQFVNFSSGT
jgi:hypothetical protein